MEKIYNIPVSQILHVHGGLLPYCDKEPVIGHGNLSKIYEFKNNARKANELFDEGTVSINNALAKYYERILKNTTQLIFANSGFFDKIKQVSSIEIIGHSLADVDIAYFRRVKSCVKSDAKWKIYYYEKERKNEMLGVIKSIGVSEDNIRTLESSSFWENN